MIVDSDDSTPVKRNQKSKAHIFIDDDYEIWAIMKRLVDCITKIRQKELSEFGVTVRQSGIMFFVASMGDKATPSRLARLTLLEPHTVSELLVRMENHGLIRKVKDLKRKNMVRVELAEKGQKIHREILKGEAAHEIFGQLSREEVQQLRPILMKLRGISLEKMGMGSRVKDKNGID